MGLQVCGRDLHSGLSLQGWEREGLPTVQERMPLKEAWVLAHDSEPGFRSMKGSGGRECWTKKF